MRDAANLGRTTGPSCAFERRISAMSGCRLGVVAAVALGSIILLPAASRADSPVTVTKPGLFAPEIIGLRPDADQLAKLARRYRVAYSVTPATATHPYTVVHSSAIYVFDRSGDARLLVPSLASKNPDLAGTAADLERLLHPDSGGVLARLRRLF